MLMLRRICFVLAIDVGLFAFGCRGGSSNRGTPASNPTPAPSTADASKTGSQKAGNEFGEMKREVQQSQEFPRLKARAEAGGALEQYEVGYCYETGDQVPQDYLLAAQWYEKSADQGFAAAQYSLGMLYEKNLGVSRDYEKAYFWLSLAASGYSEQDDRKLRDEVVSARDSAAQHLTRSQLLTEQEQTVAFETKHPERH